MIYVGSSLKRVSGYGVEPALINPKLPVVQDGTAEDMPYWPSYSELSPAARGAYLRWLAGGRCDPSANLGLVFLFFYGLERRALAEKAETSDAEWDQIHSEVRRLLDIYGGHNSFRRYATEFLGVLAATTIDADRLAEKAPVVAKSYECANLPLKTGLGWMANNGRPIPANWALTWVRSQDEFYERTPAKRCQAEFEKLFGIRYRQTFGDGVIVKPNKTPIRASYRPASASFSDSVNFSIPALPDVTVLKQPIDKLVSLANQCVDELDPYSRYLSRNPGATETAAALVLLPAELVKQAAHPTLDRIANWIQSLQFHDDQAPAYYAKLREAWPSLPAQTLSKRDAVMIAQCLGRLGYGVEPDIRFGAHQMQPEEPLVLFPLPGDAPAAPSSAYTSATLVAHLGAAIAYADNQVTEEEERALMSHAGQSLDLSAPERLRLRAYLKWLLMSPPEMSGLKRRIQALPFERRSVLGCFLAHLVGLDGHIAPAEITALQKIYRQLGLNPNDVFADTHTAATEPVAVQPAEPAPSFAIPAPAEDGRSTKSRVNLERVRAMQLESERVSILLREIFISDESADSTLLPAPHSPVTVTVRVLDLDEAHSAFTLSLIERPSWTRPELEDLASRNRLMPDGAVDAVNEAALNLHGELLLEGDDPIEVNQALRSAIQP